MEDVPQLLDNMLNKATKRDMVLQDIKNDVLKVKDDILFPNDNLDNLLVKIITLRKDNSVLIENITKLIETFATQQTEPRRKQSKKQQQQLLSKINPHPRDSQITFKEEGHRYFINGDSTDIISVTTLLNEYFTGFDPTLPIISIKKSERYNNDPDYLYYRLSDDEIREVWNKKRDRGTYYHKQIENYYNGQQYDFSADVLRVAFMNFDKYIRRLGFIPYRTEFLLFHETAKITGTADILYQHKDTGKLLLGDWKFITSLSKTSKYKAKGVLSSIDETKLGKYAMQLSLYRYILETEYAFKFYSPQNLLIILNPEKKDVDFKLEEVPYYRKEAEELVNERFLFLPTQE